MRSFNNNPKPILYNRIQIVTPYAASSKFNFFKSMEKDDIIRIETVLENYGKYRPDCKLVNETKNLKFTTSLNDASVYLNKCRFIIYNPEENK